MTFVNPLSKLLTAIRNGYIAKKPRVVLYPAPRAFCRNVLSVLQKEGMILKYKLVSVEEFKDMPDYDVRYEQKYRVGHVLLIDLRYVDKVPVLRCREMISKPSKKVYAKVSSL